jgi:hypothetical protein
MAIYLKKFETMNQYNAYTADTENFILPNVSLTVDNNVVHYNPYVVDPYNGHAYVDLGLPSGTKWATMNVGATSETDYGLYFQWGDTQGYTASQVGSGEGQKAFTWNDYKWTEDGGSTMSKYTGSDGDGKTILDLEDDAVAVAWGGSWKMPTAEQCQELIDNTNNEWTTVNNVDGYKFTNKTDSSKYIFIPAAGGAENGSIHDVGSIGFVQSSSLYSSNVNSSSCLSLLSIVGVYGSYRYGGFSVRGVVG